MAACPANVLIISMACGGSGIAPGSRPTVNTPRTSPGLPSGNRMAGPSGRCSRAVPATRSSCPKSATVTGSPLSMTRPDSDRPTGSTSPMASSAAAPAACWMTSCCRSGVGIASATAAAPDMSSVCCVIRASTSSDRAPDSSRLVTSLLARSQRCWRRASSYSRALSMATPAAAASATSSASSSSSKSAPPSFSVR